jgi:hypothetical protein
MLILMFERILLEQHYLPLLRLSFILKKLPVSSLQILVHSWFVITLAANFAYDLFISTPEHLPNVCTVFLPSFIHAPFLTDTSCINQTHGNRPIR